MSCGWSSLHHKNQAALLQIPREILTFANFGHFGGLKYGSNDGGKVFLPQATSAVEWNPKVFHWVWWFSTGPPVARANQSSSFEADSVILPLFVIGLRVHPDREMDSFLPFSLSPVQIVATREHLRKQYIHASPTQHTHPPHGAPHRPNQRVSRESSRVLRSITTRREETQTCQGTHIRRPSIGSWRWISHRGIYNCAHSQT